MNVLPAIAVVALPLRLQDPLQPEEWATLSDDERVRAERYRFDEPRIRFVRCRGLLRALLGEHLGTAAEAIRFEYGVQGRPMLAVNQAAARVSFSVSHSEDWGLIALARGCEVGVDLEREAPRENWQGLARRFFAAREVAALEALPAERQLAAFYRIWTTKEAYIKALGTGLAFPLGKFAVAVDPDQPPALLAVDDQPDEPRAWQAGDVSPAASYAATLLYRCPAPATIRCWTAAAHADQSRLDVGASLGFLSPTPSSQNRPASSGHTPSAVAASDVVRACDRTRAESSGPQEREGWAHAGDS